MEFQEINKSNYEEKLKAEFNEISLKIKEFDTMIYRLAVGDISFDFEPKTDIKVLRDQLTAMHRYKNILMDRAFEEGFELDYWKWEPVNPYSGGGGYGC